MILFKLIFAASLLHLYVGMRLVPALDSPLDLLFGLYLAGSSVLIPLALLSRPMPAPRRERLAWTGFLLMGLFSTLWVLTVVRDLLVIMAGAASLLAPLQGPAAALESLAAGSAAAIPLVAACVSAIGYWSARRFNRLREVQVPIAGLPAALEGFLIVQITDVHVGPTIGRGEVERIVTTANAQDADLIAVTGDLVDGSVEQLSAATQPLSGLRARHGVCFVTGNHEYYSGAHAWIAELRRLGLCVLMNEHVLLQHGDASVLVAGISDFSAGHFDPAQASELQRALAGAPAAALKVLLAHQPRSCFAAAPLGFDLQLSGHTHGGQFLPWPLFVRLQQPYTAGLHRLQNMWIYVSRGTGYWGPPLRLGAPSEITLLRLIRA